MKIKKFDVVELKNKNKATVLEIKGSEYLVEIVDQNGTTIDKRNITQDDIKQIVYKK